MTDTPIKDIATIFSENVKRLKPHPRIHRRRSIIREFSLNTSTHGIPSIARSQSILNRIFWTVSTLAVTGIMLYFIIESIKAYFTYPTQTSVSINVQRSQPFPAVSICNYSPLRLDTFIGPFINYTNSRNLNLTNDTSTINIAQAGFIRDFIQHLFYRNESVVNYSFPLESMLMYCSYNDQACNSTDFISFLSATYGSCYTFNAKMKSNQSDVRKTTDYGGKGKLRLVLYARSHQYVPFVAEDVSVGMMAMVHDNTELPLIEEAGIRLIPGRRHKLSYKKRTYQLLPSPYSDCTNQIPLVMQAMFNQYQGADYAYSQVLCYTLCIQTYVYKECKCVDPYQWTARSIVIPGTNQIIDAPLCNETDPCYTNARSRITNTDSIWDEYCSACSQSCSTVDFTITPSAVSAPSSVQFPYIKDFVETSGIPTPKNWSQTWLSEIENNYMTVDVVCETTRVETYTEAASMNSGDLLSNVGGQSGLWIGISFLSIMELVEIFYRLIRYHYYVFRRRRQNDNTGSEQF